MPTSLTDLRSRVAFNVGGYTGIDDKIDNAINRAMYQAIWESRPQEMQRTTTFSTSDATAEYTFQTIFSTDLWELYAILYVKSETDNFLMRRGTRSAFLNRNETSTGRPSKWFRFGNSLWLYDNVPDSTARTIRLDYLRRPLKLEDSNPLFPLNDEWIEPVETLATALLWSKLNQYEFAGPKFTEYKSLLEAMEQPEEVEDESPEGQLVPHVDME